MLRLAAIIATVVGLAAFGLALGDFASDPNPLGAVGIVVLVVLGGAALRQLHGAPRRTAATRPAPEPRRRPSQRATSASLFDDPPR